MQARKDKSSSSSQFPVFTRTNSSFRLSRTSTNTNNFNPESIYDNQSLRTLDKIPSSKASITYLDKLWTQIDVLDDVRTMSQQIREKGSFYNDKFNEELNRLKLSQEKLLDIMANQQNKPITTDKKRVKMPAASTLMMLNDNSDASEDEDEDRKRDEKVREFLGKKKGDKIIYKKQNFDEMNVYVNEVKQSLQEVSESMKNFDDTTRELW